MEKRPKKSGAAAKAGVLQDGGGVQVGSLRSSGELFTQTASGALAAVQGPSP